MFGELADIQSTFGCLFDSFLGTLDALVLIFEDLGSRSGSFSRDTLEGPRLRVYSQARVKVRSVGPVLQITYHRWLTCNQLEADARLMTR